MTEQIFPDDRLREEYRKTDAIDERFDRAERRADQLDAVVVGDDPLIVEIDSEHSGETHTLVPSTGYCGCPDARYRYGICYHLLWLAQQDSEAGRAARNGLTDMQSDLQSEIAELQEQLREKIGMADTVQYAREAVGYRRTNESTDEEIERMLEEAEAESDQTKHPFREMVEELRGDSE